MGRRAPGLDRPSTDDLTTWLQAQPLICAYTSEALTLDTLEVDHRVPLARGGSHDLANLCLTSRPANRAKGTMTDQEFADLLRTVGGWDDQGRELLKRLRNSSSI